MQETGWGVKSGLVTVIEIHFTIKQTQFTQFVHIHFAISVHEYYTVAVRDMQETGWGFKSVLVTVIRSVDETGDHFCPDILSDIFQRDFALQKLHPHMIQTHRERSHKKAK